MVSAQWFVGRVGPDESQKGNQMTSFNLSRAAFGLLALPFLAVTGQPVFGAGGTTTLTPAQSIQGAINSGLFDEIVLSEGTYNQLVDFGGAAITLRSTDPDNPAVVAATIIDGTFLGDSVITCDDDEGPDTVILGLTIMGGEATGGGPGNRGGGIRCHPGTAAPTIDRCVIRDNDGIFGGGIYNGSAPAPTIIDCVFRDNNADDGGGAYINGDCIITGTRFEGNTTTGNGGALRTQGATLTDCQFVANLADVEGGGVFAEPGSLTIDRCVFDSNAAPVGGGLYMNTDGGSSLITNSLFLRNDASSTGAGMFIRTPTEVIACTFVGNTSGNITMVDSEASSSPSFVIGCIGWDNVGPLSVFGNGSPTTTHSLIQGGLAGAGNIDSNPLFVDAGADDYRLQTGSPAIDAGDALALLSADPRDYAGNTRVVDDPATANSGIVVFKQAVDMGAYEFQPVGGNPDCPADVNSDGMINVLDLLDVLAAWGMCP